MKKLISLLSTSLAICILAHGEPQKQTSSQAMQDGRAEFQLAFLGTAAADFSPKLKNEFARRFDFDARRSSAMLVNEHALIDCGPHTLQSLEIIGKNTGTISDIFLTHLHKDHFNAANIQKIALSRKTPLRLWVRHDAKLPAFENVEIIYMNRHHEYQTNHGFTITGLYANHDENSAPQHLLFKKGGKSFLYACDGAWFLTSTYNFLKKARLDLLVLDATVGNYDGDFRIAEHNSIPMIKLMLPSLRTVKIIDDNTAIYLSHLAPSLHASHAETVKITAPMGVKIAYDGLILKL